VFRDWTKGLPRGIDLCPVQLPGRENRLAETLFTRLAPLVETLAQALQPYLVPPYAFFGHSLGGLISFELTRQLRRLQRPGPAHLFVSGIRAPQLSRVAPSIHDLPDYEFVQEVRRLAGTPQAILENTELLQLLLPLLRADFAVYESYVYAPEEPLACPISAFGGLQDSDVRHDDLVPWQEQTQGAFMLRMLPGNHFFLHSAQALLLQGLSSTLGPYTSHMRGSDV
jgi:medium-chain acyl-[acyl-carrier-protein] hydrolase